MAKSIGVMYWCKSESDFVLVKQYMEYLRNEHGMRKVRALAFLDLKEAPNYILTGVHHDFMINRDLKWNRKPFGDIYDKFVEHPYDILVDLTDGDCLPLHFALKQSNARFKVGKADVKTEEEYDLLVDLDSSSTFDLYIKKINYVLQRINYKAQETQYA